jgi:hypothetical protein
VKVEGGGAGSLGEAAFEIGMATQEVHGEASKGGGVLSETSFPETCRVLAEGDVQAPV